MDTVALAVFFLALIGSRLVARRSLALLTVEQKARVLEATSAGNIWYLVCLAIAIVIPWRFAPSSVTAYLRPGVFVAILATLACFPLGAALIRLLRLSRLGLPQPYVVRTGLSTLFFYVGLLFLLYTAAFEFAFSLPR